MKKNNSLIYIVFIFIAFFIFGAINVNAETITVDSKNTFINEFKNITNTSDIVQLQNDIDMSDINYEQQLYIYKDKTIDLKGNTLTLPNYRFMIWYYANATVKFIDSSEGKTGKILGADNSTGDYPLISVWNEKPTTYTETYLVFDGVKISRKTDVYGQVIGPYGSGKINKVSFINCDITRLFQLQNVKMSIFY